MWMASHRVNSEDMLVSHRVNGEDMFSLRCHLSLASRSRSESYYPAVAATNAVGNANCEATMASSAIGSELFSSTVAVTNFVGVFVYCGVGTQNSSD